MHIGSTELVCRQVSAHGCGEVRRAGSARTNGCGAHQFIDQLLLNLVQLRTDCGGQVFCIVVRRVACFMPCGKQRGLNDFVGLDLCPEESGYDRRVQTFCFAFVYGTCDDALLARRVLDGSSVIPFCKRDVSAPGLVCGLRSPPTVEAGLPLFALFRRKRRSSPPWR